jgi:hypothetical protein
MKYLSTPRSSLQSGPELTEDAFEGMGEAKRFERARICAATFIAGSQRHLAWGIANAASIMRSICGPAVVVPCFMPEAIGERCPTDSGARASA